MHSPHNGIPLTIALWQKEPPFAGNEHPDLPRLTIYLPSEECKTGQAVIICPGGGYGGLSVPKEGHRVARLLSSHGHAAAVLEYRFAPYRHPIPLIDAQRAIRLLRHNAKEWQIDSNQIGIMGFSAGGHLAGTTATFESEQSGIVGDSIDQESCHPDFAILVYPVVTFQETCAHLGSRDNLLGGDASNEMVEALSLENAVSAKTPPTLLIHTNEDEAVPPENSILYYSALRAEGVPVEMHIYEKGGHGIGLANNHPWGDAVLSWLENGKSNTA